MIIEYWLWIIAGIVLSEIIFIFWYRHACKNEGNEFKGLFTFDSDDWWIIKILSLLIGGFFTFFQFVITCVSSCGEETFVCPIHHYEYLLYEFLVIVVVVLFFMFNKWLIKKINGENIK